MVQDETKGHVTRCHSTAPGPMTEFLPSLQLHDSAATSSAATSSAAMSSAATTSAASNEEHGDGETRSWASARVLSMAIMEFRSSIRTDLTWMDRAVAALSAADADTGDPASALRQLGQFSRWFCHEFLVRANVVHRARARVANHGHKICSWTA